MTKIISVIQNKGGVGKTTTTQNLGYLFSKLGPALLVDLDSQKLSLNGLENIFTEIDNLKSQDITNNFKAKLLGLIFNKYKKTVITDQIIENVRANYDVFNTVIRDSIQVVESQAENKTIIEYSINNNVSKDFQELFKEVFKKING